MPVTTRDDLTLYYDVAGTGGDPVIWLQGLGADHTAWAVQVAHFSRRFRCILPDSRDTGRSGRSPGGYTLATLAADALAVLDAAGVERAHVVGLSMGAGVAQELALLAPERVRSLALLSAFARQDARMRAVAAGWSELCARLDRESFYRQTEPWLFSPTFFETSANLRALRGYVARQPNPQAPEAFARQVAALAGHDTRDRLGAIRAPALVIHGEQDVLAPPARGREVAEAIPGARWELRTGVAHSVNLEGQRAFNALLEAFLRDATP